MALDVSAAKEEFAVKLGDLQSYFNGKLDEMAVAAESEAVARESIKFKEGQDSMTIPPTGTGDMLYTQEDANRIAEQSLADGRAAATAELQPQIDALAGQVAALQAELAGVRAELEIVKGDVQGQVAEGVKLGKAAVVEKVRAFKAAGDSQEDALIAELEIL